MHLQIKILTYIDRMASVTNAQIRGAFRPTRGENIEDALRELRDDGAIAIANGRWYRRQSRTG